MLVWVGGEMTRLEELLITLRNRIDLHIVNEHMSIDSDDLKTLLHNLNRKDNLISRLKEDGERLEKGLAYKFYRRSWYCSYCQKGHVSFDDVPNIQHRPDCPVTLHRQLIAEIGEEK